MAARVRVPASSANVGPGYDAFGLALAFYDVFAEVGHAGAAWIRCENAIPVGRGLGSSAAAVVGGLVLGNELSGGGLTKERRALPVAVTHADAGPTVIGLVIAPDDAAALERARRLSGLLPAFPGRHDPLVLAVDRDGAAVH